MPLFRKKINKTVLELHKARTGYGLTKNQQAIFAVGIRRNKFLLEQQLVKQAQKRKSGVKGLIRTKANPQAMQRLKRMKEAQMLTKTNPKKVSLNKAIILRKK